MLLPFTWLVDTMLLPFTLTQRIVLLCFLLKADYSARYPNMKKGEEKIDYINMPNSIIKWRWYVFLSPFSMILFGWYHSPFLLAFSPFLHYRKPVSIPLKNGRKRHKLTLGGGSSRANAFTRDDHATTLTKVT
ncbi:hypothetical protein AMTRI_Chr09g34170 [Amborella trichopoda]